MYCVFLGKAVQTVNPPNSSVGTSQLDSSLDFSSKTITLADNMKNTPAFSAVAASDQSISTTTVTVLNFGTELYDTDSAYDGTNKFTVPTGKDGKYFFNAHVRLNGVNDGNFVQCGFYVNGSSDVGGENYSTITQQVSPSASTAIYFGTTAIINLTAGDYVQVFIYQNGGTLSTGSGYVGFRGFKLIG
jgi:hypothetical protein